MGRTGNYRLYMLQPSDVVELTEKRMPEFTRFRDVQLFARIGAYPAPEDTSPLEDLVLFCATK